MTLELKTEYMLNTNQFLKIHYIFDIVFKAIY